MLHPIGGVSLFRLVPPFVSSLTSWRTMMLFKIYRMHLSIPRVFSGLIVVVLCANVAAAQNPSPALTDQVHAIASEHHGDVALFAENLKTHETVAISPDTPVQTASVIKLA